MRLYCFPLNNDIAVHLKMKKRIFFTGAGFSKALCSAYPTLLELSKVVSTNFLSRNSSGAIREHYNQLPHGLDSDVEQLLSYLYTDWPWKSSVDRDLDRALYKALIYEISSYLLSIPIQPLTEVHKHFIGFIGRKDNRIVTLNYDTLIQDLHSRHSWNNEIFYSSLRIYIEDVFERNPLTTLERPWIIDDTPGERYLKTLRIRREYLAQLQPEQMGKLIRSANCAFWTTTTPEMFFSGLGKGGDESGQFYIDEAFDKRILKLHGSITWHENSNDTTIRVQDSTGNMQLERIPIIVPPILDKSQHYAIDRLRLQWADTHLAMEQADEIIIIGFSFPPTDISCPFLFKSALKSRDKVRVIVINTDSLVRQRYDSIFGDLPGVDIDYSYLGHNDSLGLYVKNDLMY